ncbi:MAG: hypothetical protein WA728_04815 [Xanthobacteraceae bacterium]
MSVHDITFEELLVILRTPPRVLRRFAYERSGFDLPRAFWIMKYFSKKPSSVDDNGCSQWTQKTA